MMKLIEWFIFNVLPVVLALAFIGACWFIISGIIIIAGA